MAIKRAGVQPKAPGGIQPLQTQMRPMAPKPPVAPSPVTDPSIYQPTVSKAVATDPAFQRMRETASLRVNAQGQQASDALQRKFAQLGNLNSGAALKQEQGVQNAIAQQKEEAMANLDAQQAQIQEARDARDFAANEAALQRRLSGSQFDRTFAEQLRQNQFGERLALDEHALNVFNTKFNTAMSLGTSDAQQAIGDSFNMLFNENIADAGNAAATGQTGAIERKATFDPNNTQDMIQKVPFNKALLGHPAGEPTFVSQAAKMGYNERAAKDAYLQMYHNKKRNGG